MGVAQAFSVIHSYLDTWTPVVPTREGAVHLAHVFAENAAPAVAAMAGDTEGGRGGPFVSRAVLSRAVFDTDLPSRHSPAVLDLAVPRPPPPVLYPPTSLPAPAPIPSFFHESPASDLSLPLLTPAQEGSLSRSTLAVDPPYSYLPPGLNSFLPRPTAVLNPPPPRLALALPQREDPHKQDTPRSVRRTSPRVPQALPERPLTSESPDEAPKGAQEPRSESPRDKGPHPERQDGQHRVSPHKKLHMDAVPGLEETARLVTKVASNRAFAQGVADLARDVTNTSFDAKPCMQSGPASAVATVLLPGEDALSDPAGAAAPGEDCLWAEDDSGCFEGMSSSSDPSTALPPLAPSPACDSFGLLEKYGYQYAGRHYTFVETFPYRLQTS
ncbi:pollen-specific leucine-rich repeat extensin-like protein 1 [Penaeus chinensis]|uniref:pollen-specific leucine-rich repeat extensin-like protein 1 n=1 Tax=Penaeus chinensis TaxID=139456 RepID=UPI001FB6C070|nr:pollen-specific leucine-rich repeat extensin-like protein 1 [Penaeus chinensis]